jgi:hypothetical protein
MPAEIREEDVHALRLPKNGDPPFERLCSASLASCESPCSLAANL